MAEPARALSNPNRLLTAREVAEILGQSERWARDWIKRTPGRVVFGIGIRVTYKIPLRIVEQYRNRGGDQPWRGSTYDAGFGGAGATMPAANDGHEVPSSETGKPPNVLPIVSSSTSRIRLTMPARSRSSRRSTNS